MMCLLVFGFILHTAFTGAVNMYQSDKKLQYVLTNTIHNATIQLTNIYCVLKQGRSG